MSPGCPLQVPHVASDRRLLGRWCPGAEQGPVLSGDDRRQEQRLLRVRRGTNHPETRVRAWRCLGEVERKKGFFDVISWKHPKTSTMNNEHPRSYVEALLITMNTTTRTTLKHHRTLHPSPTNTTFNTNKSQFVNHQCSVFPSKSFKLKHLCYMNIRPISTLFSTPPNAKNPRPPPRCLARRIGRSPSAVWTNAPARPPSMRSWAWTREPLTRRGSGFSWWQHVFAGVWRPKES